MSRAIKSFAALVCIAPLFVGIAPAESANITYSFKHGGATGNVGPTQVQLNNTYSGTTLQGLVTSNNGIQEWVVPASGEYEITAVGAGGGNGMNGPSQVSYTGGSGASLTGTFNLTGGTTIRIIVGQKGVNSFNQANWYGVGGGGGGSFVYINATDTYPLIAAGGGGGASSTAGMNAVESTTATNGNGDPTGTTPSRTPGSGGALASTSTSSGGAGAGWLSDGDTYTYVSCSGFGTAGFSPRNGGKGGYSNTLLADGSGTDPLVRQGNGGFGGGGAGHGRCIISGAGGGGGYSGGGGGGYLSGFYKGAGGGGSYNAGTNPIFNGSTNVSNGSVTIVRIQGIPVSFNSMALAGNATTATYRSVINLVANVDVASRITFTANGRRIPGCIGVATTGISPNITATCRWAPSTRGSISLSAIAKPIGSGSPGSPATALNVVVRGRTANR